jgi:Rad3-related DNA helicase
MDANEPNWHELVPEVVLRHQQEEALHRLWTALFVDGKRVALLEAPTGVGKSVIQLALCRYQESLNGKSFVVTPQRQLQDQMRAWEGVRVMKGRASYKCGLVDATAAAAPCLSSSEIRESNPNTCADNKCAYFSALRQAVDSSTTIHNYASLMAQSNISRHFGPRSLLCLDEGHTAVSWIRNYMSCEFSPEELASLTTLKCPEPKDASKFMVWIRKILSSILDGSDEYRGPKGIQESLIATLLKINAHTKEFGLVSREDYNSIWHSEREHGEVDLDELDKKVFGDSGTVPWATQFIEPDRWHPNGQWATIPLKVAPMASVLTKMGTKIVIVTATVLNKALMCLELGIKAEDAEFVRIDSAFDKKNRPVVKMYAGSMSFKRKKTTFPRIIDNLVSVANKHRNEQGMIHTVSHSTAWEVVKELRARLHRPIEIVPRGPDRDDVIARFLSGGLGPSAILVGPALLEGIDGKDDSCRWQAMIKAPWPSMSDPVVDFLLNSKNENTRKWAQAWYLWKSAQQTVQGIGRVCRSPSDFGVTYLMDSDFDRIIDSGYVPKYVLDALVR